MGTAATVDFECLVKLVARVPSDSVRGIEEAVIAELGEQRFPEHFAVVLRESAEPSQFEYIRQRVLGSNADVAVQWEHFSYISVDIRDVAGLLLVVSVVGGAFQS